MKKRILPLLALLPLGLSAQTEYADTMLAPTATVEVGLEGSGEQFDFPEALAESNIDSLMNLYLAKTYLTENDDCEMSAENPYYDDKVYIDRLRRLPTVMELPYNEVVRSCIDRYMVRLRRKLGYILGAANFYMPICEQALDLYQLPLELKYLPVIESALDPVAVSRAGATGLWQFMLKTGKAYGLEVTSMIDDRRDPVKSSMAAARYLRDLYNIFGDWNLVIAAYNCGPENINRAIRRSGGKRDYWEIYHYLPKETRGYVPAFIAANYAMNYYSEHGICPMAGTLPAKTDTVMLNCELTFEQLAEVCHLDLGMIRSLNPIYRRGIVPGASAPSPLRLPASDVGRFIEMEDSLYALAKLYPRKRTEVEIEKPNRQGRRRGLRDEPGTGQQGNDGAKWITVKRGDTLGAIAKRYHTTVRNLRQLNGLSNDRIRAGKKIRVK